MTAATSSTWDFSGATSFRVPSSGGAAPTLDGLLSFDSIAHNLVWGSNGVTKTGATKSGATVSGDCAKWDASGNLIDGGAACGGVGPVLGTSPIVSSGGTTPALSCPTCVTSAGALNNLSIVAGAGSHASQVTNITTDVGLNNLTVAGSITTDTAAGSPHGKIAMQELLASGSTTVGWEAPDLITSTVSYQFPNAVPIGNQAMRFAAPSSGISAMTFADAAAIGTCTNQVVTGLTNTAGPHSRPLTESPRGPFHIECAGATRSSNVD